ncbi:hypothetical protein HBI56_073320 [Parastagonospora nodorum]|uniref:LysM domain-containing protein n=2 Tax=Phaeosphaeria nodorum (strain SN15 / ATCC MYA-4574 / FGSC 10173) TaxID=321614 RepID=A0A7U2EWY1_PHANO|nr:hypothetical protein SNOG_07772 [Parastagonospora nodorum SN15]KAH3908753.1 hypothetical protein HBH56_171640 [Parastagonospora nodorum]EAT85238.2 hypothetical protein SNOG_07772 [Parastagonospora nodorum SN15]KAH3928414.1 hypothetical protein HBH54_140200 [Parastagonospora nodorum]KAH3945315.1 hypothetical protein HBH53_145550 [Parastagonospora nodorum]KAH3984007.1 hypothetical protein HBH52_058670 [Parastagonospora nodorum]
MLVSATLAVVALVHAASGAALPSDCSATHFVERDESCVSIVNQYNNFTAPDLYRWNPSIGLVCNGLIAGDSICINVQPYTYPGPIQGGAIFKAEQNPVPQLPDIAAGCKTFQYTDSKGYPDVPTMSTLNNISRTMWNNWNWGKETGAYGRTWGSYFSCVGRK